MRRRRRATGHAFACLSKFFSDAEGKLKHAPPEARKARMMSRASALVATRCTSALTASARGLKVSKSVGIRVPLSRSRRLTQTSGGRSLWHLRQRGANVYVRSGRHGNLPLPLGKARHENHDDMSPGADGNDGRGVADIPAVDRDFSAGRRRSEMALCRPRTILQNHRGGPILNAVCRVRDFGTRLRGWRRRRRAGSRNEGIRLFDFLALRIPIPNRESALFPLGFKRLPCRERDTPGPSECERRLVG